MDEGAKVRKHNVLLSEDVICRLWDLKRGRMTLNDVVRALLGLYDEVCKVMEEAEKNERENK